MGYVTPEQISKAKEIDLLTYLRSCDPHELVHVSGGTYCTREHDSLKISNGKWNWFSRGIGGKTALDYLIKVQGFSFTQAVEALVGQTFSPLPYTPQTKPKEHAPRKLLLPQASRCATHAVSYLHGRGIDHDVIDYCIQTGRLYESQPYHNVVFLGRDMTGKPRYAALRGTVGDYKGEATGSDKRYSFCIADTPGTGSVHLFESAIDLLSYATLLKVKGHDWWQDALLSLAGVFKPKRPGVVPLALSQYLQDHPGTKTLHLHLDNDEVGRCAAVGIMEGLGDKYTIWNRPPPYGKDVNELLQRQLGLTRRKEEWSR
ncbi:MAG: DUF3991 and toprim domain-containing protein [Oscillospiraceae bacterium]|nr:DUF3991 and toprim domain-containing protein [Oscillospiraceae bacterium]